MVKKAVGCHPSNRFFTLCYYSASLPFLHSILASVLNNWGRKVCPGYKG